jgi:hypothetical protein
MNCEETIEVYSVPYVEENPNSLQPRNYFRAQAANKCVGNEDCHEHATANPKNTDVQNLRRCKKE